MSAKLQQDRQKQHTELQQAFTYLQQQQSVLHQILTQHDELRGELIELRRELETIRQERGELQPTSRPERCEARPTAMAPQVGHEGLPRPPDGSDRDSRRHPETQPLKHGNKDTPNNCPFLKTGLHHKGSESGPQSEEPRPDPSDGASAERKTKGKSKEGLDGRLSAATSGGSEPTFQFEFADSFSRANIFHQPARELPPDRDFAGSSFFFVPRMQREMKSTFPPNMILHDIAMIRPGGAIAVHMNEMSLKGDLKRLDLGPETPLLS